MKPADVRGIVSSFFAQGGAKSATAAMVLAHFSADRVVEQRPTGSGQSLNCLRCSCETDDVTTRMPTQPESSPSEVLAGVVERVTYHNVENGFCVLRAKARGHSDVVTVVGHAATIAAGEWITASGEWVNDRTHGQQFKARFLRTSAPTSADGIEKYLASGMIRGVGPVYAKKLVRAFGEKVFEISADT